MAFDWHQVSDTFRFTCCRTEFCKHSGRWPTLSVTEIWSLFCPIFTSRVTIGISYSGQCTSISFPIDLVVITKERCGVAGKLYALGALSPYSTTCCLVDGNIEVALEFARFNAYFSQSCLEFYHIRVPRKPTCEETGFPSAWNVQQHLPKIREVHWS